MSDFDKLSDFEVVTYYGQIWANVKHMRQFIAKLHNQYKTEVLAY